MLFQDPSTPFQFVSDHIHMLGWGTFIYAIIQVVWWARGMKDKFQHMYKQTTNEMPHSLDRIDRNIALLVSLKGVKPAQPGDDE